MINIKNIKPKDTKLGIIGAGKSGLAASKLAKHLGFNVFLSDSNKDIPEAIISGIEFEKGKHSNKLLESNFIIKSPGIPNNIDIIEKAIKKNIPIISEIEFASWFSLSPIIGLTGTNGKTTTVNLIHNIFLKAGFQSMIGGNIGIPFSENVYTELLNKKRKSIHILELSSFQLEHIIHLSLEVACILNISEDHLDRYNNFNKYVQAKLNILDAVKDGGSVVYNNNDKILSKKIYDAHNIIPFNSNDVKFNKLELEDTPLKGKHNQSNIAAALAISKIYNIDIKTFREVIGGFNPLPHRLEYILTWNNTEIYNDSKATNIDSMIVAIDSFRRDIIMVVGGSNKGNIDFFKAFKEYSNKLVFIACYGESGELIFNQIKNHIKSSYNKDFKISVLDAISRCKGNDVLLFSPGCASYDQFNSYIERGNKFKEIIFGLS